MEFMSCFYDRFKGISWEMVYIYHGIFVVSSRFEYCVLIFCQSLLSYDSYKNGRSILVHIALSTLQTQYKLIWNEVCWLIIFKLQLYVPCCKQFNFDLCWSIECSWSFKMFKHATAMHSCSCFGGGL